MDIYPSGFPGLVGPEGGYDFSHFDFASQFRVLPSNGSIDASFPTHDTLSLRSPFQSPHLHASPSNSTTPRLPQPLRVGEDSGKNFNNGHGSKLGSPRPLHYSFPGLDSALNSPSSKRLAHSVSVQDPLPQEEMKGGDGEGNASRLIQSDEHLALRGKGWVSAILYKQGWVEPAVCRAGKKYAEASLLKEKRLQTSPMVYSNWSAGYHLPPG